MWKNKNLTDYLFNKWWTLTVPKLLLALLLSWLFRACRLPVSFCLCCGIFCLTDSCDEKCQTWLLPEPTHLWPWPYQPWPSQRNQFPRFLSSLFWLLRWGMKGFFCLPTVSTVLPAYQLFQWLLLQSWMGFKDGAVRGGKEGSYFRISALLD